MITMWVAVSSSLVILTTGGRLRPWLIAVIGGVKSVGGAAVSVVLVVVFRELLRYGIPRLTDATATSYELVLFGLLLAFIVIVAPRGLIAPRPLLVDIGAYEYRQAAPTMHLVISEVMANPVDEDTENGVAIVTLTLNLSRAANT